MTEIYKTLDSTVQDKTWIESHSEEDIKLLTDARDMSLNLLSQVGIFIDLFHQYIDLIQANAIFSDGFARGESNDGDVSPTQTPPAPANRAEKRAAAKQGLLVPEKKLIVP